MPFPGSIPVSYICIGHNERLKCSHESYLARMQTFLVSILPIKAPWGVERQLVS